MHFKSFALYIPAMGSLGDLRFTPLSDRLPIEVFISIIEHEASDRNLSDLETVRMAIRHLDTKALSSSHFKTGMLSIPHFSMQCNVMNNTYKLKNETRQKRFAKQQRPGAYLFSFAGIAEKR